MRRSSPLRIPYAFLVWRPDTAVNSPFTRSNCGPRVLDRLSKEAFVSLTLSFSFSLSLGRERATLGRYERGSLLLRRRPVVKPVSMCTGYRVVLNSLYSAVYGLGRDLPCPCGTTAIPQSKQLNNLQTKISQMSD